jgi:hypothetical protein
MKHLQIKKVILFGIFVPVISCSKSSSSNTSTCTASTGDLAALTSNKRVTYEASITMAQR